MDESHSHHPLLVAPAEREIVLRVMAAAAFLIFFQGYLVAPLIPSLAAELHASAFTVGLLVPAYMLPYGISTLFYGPISDRAGRRGVLLTMLAAMAVATAGTASARTAEQLLAWRCLAGAASGGVIPISLALFGDLFPYAERGRPLGWIFGAIAGGMAFGSTFGALLNPVVGWRAVFLGIGGVCLIVFLVAYRHRSLLTGRRSEHPPGIVAIGKSYLALASLPRGRRAYAFIFVNGTFHSGVFSWLGLYFADRYRLGDQGIGLALLGYGIPGLLLGPAIGRLADRVGRRTIIPAGFLLAALAAAAIAPAVPLAWAVAAATVLSLGMDMSHPLLAGIITSLDPARRGQAMGLNAFFLFTGFGVGPLLFQQILPHGFGAALAVFAGFQLLASILAVPAFRSEGTAAGASVARVPAVLREHA
jgi:predicted MFS family arabinose efflux permease